MATTTVSHAAARHPSWGIWMKALFKSLMFCLVCTVASLAGAVYPEKVVKIIVGYAPGGVSDLNARIFAERLSSRLGQPVIVENRPGASGTLAPNLVAKAAPDGYTLAFMDAVAVNSTFVRANSIDALSQLVPISTVGFGSYFIFVNPERIKGENIQDLLKYAKAQPRGLNAGVQASTAKLGLANFKAATGLDYQEIPYPGSVPSMMALLAGTVDLTFDAAAPYLPHLRADKLKALMVASDLRSPVMPDVPSALELGIKGLSETDFVQGLWAPAGTPKEIVERLSTDTQAILAQQDVRNQFLSRTSTVTRGSTPAEYRRIVETKVRFWEDAARKANYVPQ